MPVLEDPVKKLVAALKSGGLDTSEEALVRLLHDNDLTVTSTANLHAVGRDWERSVSGIQDPTPPPGPATT